MSQVNAEQELGSSKEGMLVGDTAEGPEQGLVLENCLWLTSNMTSGLQHVEDLSMVMLCRGVWS